jgi:hypothetical protein
VCRDRDVDVALGHNLGCDVDGLAPGSRGQPLGRRTSRLRLVEPEERAAAAVAEEDDAFEPSLLQPTQSCRDVEQEPLMHHVDVVVEVAAVVAEDRVAVGRQPGHNVVPGELAAWVHQIDAGPWFALRRAVEDAEALGGVRRLQPHDVPPHGVIELRERERQPPGTHLGRLCHVPSRGSL